MVVEMLVSKMGQHGAVINLPISEEADVTAYFETKAEYICRALGAAKVYNDALAKIGQIVAQEVDKILGR